MRFEFPLDKSPSSRFTLTNTTPTSEPHTFKRKMFCTSLRKRKDWASVPSTLLSQQQRKWQGTFLNKIILKDLQG
jgi:hypothetical protein